MKWRYKLVALAAALLSVAAVASAAPITGVMNLTGSTRVDAATINWVPPDAGATETGFGTFVTVVPGSGYFTGITSPQPPTYFGSQRDITRNPALAGAAPLPAFAPVGVPIFIDGYLRNFTAPGYGGLDFDLTLILQSTAPVCTGAEGVGQSCRPDAGSPFTFTRLSEGTAIAFELRGFFEDTNVANSRSDVYKGRYTTQVGESVPQILGIIGSGGSITASFSGNFEQIPEPGTVGLALTGLALILTGVIRRRRA